MVPGESNTRASGMASRDNKSEGRRPPSKLEPSTVGTIIGSVEYKNGPTSGYLWSMLSRLMFILILSSPSEGNPGDTNKGGGKRAEASSGMY